VYLLWVDCLATSYYLTRVISYVTRESEKRSKLNCPETKERPFHSTLRLWPSTNHYTGGLEPGGNLFISLLFVPKVSKVRRRLLSPTSLSFPVRSSIVCAFPSSRFADRKGKKNVFFSAGGCGPLLCAVFLVFRCGKQNRFSVWG